MMNSALTNDESFILNDEFCIKNGQWALIWSAPYPDFVDGGSGIFFAFEPWSGAGFNT